MTSNSLVSLSTEWNMHLTHPTWSKCVHTKFGASQNPPYSINNDILLQQCTEHKNLGVSTTSTKSTWYISWLPHAPISISYAYKSNGLFRCVVYLVRVRSHLTHYSQIWRAKLTKDFRIVEKLWKRAMRFITKSSLDYKSRLINLYLSGLNSKILSFLSNC